METSQQQRGSTIGQFAKTLADAKLDFDAIDLVDILWLAQFIEPVKSLLLDTQPQKTVERIQKHTDKSDNNEPTLHLYPNEPSSPQKPETIPPAQKVEQKAEKQSKTPFSVPAAPALRNRLDLARSLRPLMRKVSSRTRFDLDEDATVAQIAETGVWLPVVRAVPERWLQLDLVVEESKTTVIWERAIMELKHLVEYQGAFRSVRTWRLSAQTGKVQLFPRWRDGSIHSVAKTELAINQRFHTPGELIDPTGRSLIWLVTDCTSALWRQSLIYETLLAWSKVQPIAIFQMFPERLWSRTALRDGHIVKLGALLPGLLSNQLLIEGLPQRLERRNHEDLVTVSIITLDAASMLCWARVASGFGDHRTPGRTFDLSFIRRQAEKGKLDSSPRSSSERTAQERVALFRSIASKTAQQLANLMAATPVTLPVIDLLRDTFQADFQEEVQQSHVAEVLLSGLLRRCDTEEDDVCRYEFWGDNSRNGDERVRDILLGDTSILKTIEVLNVLSTSICQKLGSPSKTFEALLVDIQALEGDQWDAVLPFARVGLDVLRRLGGEYAALAQRYSSVTELEVLLLKTLPPLQEFPFEVATIIIEADTATPQGFNFEVAIITGINQSNVSNNPLEIADNLVFSQTEKHLTEVEQLIIQETISNRTYEQIAASSNYSTRQLKNVANNLWKVLSEALGEKINKTNLKQTIQRQVNYSQIDIHRSLRQARYFIEDLDNGIQLEMVAIPEGSFMMGSPEDEPERYSDESPQHQVTVSAFFMGKYPITQAQWKAVAALPQVNIELEADPSNFKGDQRPVEQVSWYDTVEFCDRLSQYTGRPYSLPSEAKWEYACRAGTTTPFHFGETITSKLANYNANYTYGAGVKGTYRKETTVVGSFGVANAFGLYDMHGNVWEWCLDDWHSNYEDAPIDGSAWLDDNNNLSQKQGRAVLRGGSWDNVPSNCRSAFRLNNVNRDNLGSNIGFRIVCGVGRILQ
ncbi:formylglycine-generating enzyme family protein (plasmid) [Nostoc sp. UHCC 0926]|uniref:formylglycine-generating enzyme family protein n=1 Tax=Nostoc sp. UHCC 0926 TaxID=3025190 RepID=UPI00235E4846|nr:formylglycine-generating enzyme family protein [Nostoc sp. UHCC 0926]WDD36066.1 formylglycine-generating enzyme family protein [Nostoc sp. UHCC 0926]